MENGENKSLDILGVKPVADSMKICTQAAIDGASAFLGRICLPAAEEFGLLLQDKVRNWRQNNSVKMIHDAEIKFNKFNGNIEKHAHPRLVSKIIEQGSWVDEDMVQAMWAGLLASSCTEDGKDESNLIFTSILGQITSLQGRVVNYSCENAKIYITQAGWIAAEEMLVVDLKVLEKITECSDFHRLDRELDHLRSLELIQGGFDPNSTNADITPSALALQLYVRSQGYIGSPIDYFGLEKKNDLDATQQEGQPEGEVQ